MGTLVTFTLYLATLYLAESNASRLLFTQPVREEVTTASSSSEEKTTESPEGATEGEETESRDVLAGVKSWVESTLVGGADSGAFTSVIHITARNYLLPIAYSSRGYLEGVLHGVNSTWGQRTEGWTVAVGTKGAEISSPHKNHNHLLLAESCDDFVPDQDNRLSPEQYFCLLKSIHDSYIDNYQWFVIIDSYTYVAVNHLVQTLLQFDSSEIFYIGKPASYDVTEMNRFGLVQHEKICKIEAGIVLSRAALKKIVPQLKSCRGYGIGRGWKGRREMMADVEIGRCFSRRLGVTCSHSIKVSSKTTSFTSQTPDPSPKNLVAMAKCVCNRETSIMAFNSLS